MTYDEAAVAAPSELLQLAQGLVLLAKEPYLLTEQLTGYRAQRVLEEQAGSPGNRFGLSISSCVPFEQGFVVCVGGWEEYGIFLAREPATETERVVTSIDWADALGGLIARYRVPG